MTGLRSSTAPSIDAPASIAVMFRWPSMQETAAGIASALALPLISRPEEASGFDLILEPGPKGLSLAPTDHKQGGKILIDFVHGPAAYRRLAVGSTRQPLAKAIGMTRVRPSVLDATAGLGRDVFQLACLGCRIRAVERSPILAAMLSDALVRAARTSEPKLSEIIERIDVTLGDSKTMLMSLPTKDRPDVVYLDPMYPPRASSALAKKEMRILRMLVGDDQDSGDLLRIARTVATKRVVVKRHLRAAPLAEDVSVSFPGRAVRYDVYLIPPE